MRTFNRSNDIIKTAGMYTPPAKQRVDWSKLMDNIGQGVEDYQDNVKKQALVNALQSGNTDEINAAYSAYDPTGAMANKLKMDQLNQQREWSLSDAERNHQWDLEAESRKFDNALKLANYKHSLSGNSDLNNQAIANQLGIQLTGNKTYDNELLKDAAQRAGGERSAEEMKPALLDALSRAETAADSGDGLGLLGATAEKIGLNVFGDSGNNYEDVKTANAQMNAYLRQKLQATGLTGSELNSAAEAEAYRYSISPWDTEDRIKRKIANFKADYLGNKPKSASYYKNKYSGME